MAVIAVAGGNGNVAPHIVDALIAKREHRIVILSRKRQAHLPSLDNVDQKCVNYNDVEDLVAVLQGVDVVLSFILPYSDPNNASQKSLIDACVRAGVHRFAPSEWALASDTSNPFYEARSEIRRYLEKVNEPVPRLEYTCFQPGLFLDYFTYPRQSAAHLKITQHYIDFESRQAILIGNGEQPVTFTLIDDLARVVAEAVCYKGRWPTQGGVAGWQTTSAELVRIGERLRGAPFTIHRVKPEDLETGTLASPWCPVLRHPALAEDQAEMMSRKINCEVMRGILRGEWSVGDDWNQLLPEIKYRDPVAFLEKWWIEPNEWAQNVRSA